MLEKLNESMLFLKDTLLTFDANDMKKFANYINNKIDRALLDLINATCIE